MFSDDFKTFDDSGVVSLNKYLQLRNLECILNFDICYQSENQIWL